MQNITNKTDGVDTLAAVDFNSLKNEIQGLVTESGQTLAIGTTDQLRKAVSVYSRSNYATDSSGVANVLTLSRPSSLKDIPAYFNGLIFSFSTANANTGAVTATFAGLSSKKVRTTSDTDLIVGDIIANEIYTVSYNSTFDSGAGAFVLFRSQGKKLWQNQAVTITPPTNADYTLTATENGYGRLILVNGAWTAAHNLIVDTSERSFLVDNSAGSYTATVKTSAKTGRAVLAGTKVWLLCDGTNVIESVSNKTGQKNILINGRKLIQQRGTTGGKKQVVLNTMNAGGSHTISFTGTATVTIKEATTLAASDALTTWDTPLATSAASGTTVTLTAGKYVHVEFSTTDFNFAQLEQGSVVTNFEYRHSEKSLCLPYYEIGNNHIYNGSGATQVMGIATRYASHKIKVPLVSITAGTVESNVIDSFRSAASAPASVWYVFSFVSNAEIFNADVGINYKEDRWYV